MPRVWVVNASPAIVLAKAGMLDLLGRLADELLLPEAVASELLAGPSGDPARAAVESGWGTRIAVERAPTAIVEWGLGAGESSVLAVALERQDAIAVIDDAEARACARALKIRLTGTLGILARAFRAGSIPSLDDAIEKIRAAGLFVDDALVSAVLAWAKTRAD
jgi:predicted nucleic acid-binding protein